MNLLIVVVREPERLDDFLSVLVQLDVAGIQVIETASSLGVLAREAPIFAGLRQLVTRPEAYGRTILGLTDRDDVLDELARMLRRVDVELDATGYALTVPVGKLVGRPEVDAD